MALIFEERTRLLHRCFFDVHNEVGHGRQEEAYHAACKLWLEEQNIPFMSKHPHALLFRGEIAHALIPDLVAWDSITIELKAVSRSLRKAEFVQLFDYLKRRNDRIGLLVNMGLGRVEVERVLYTPRQTSLKEDWRYWEGCISGYAREIGIAVRDAFRMIYFEHTTGYGSEIVEQLIMHALQASRLSVTVRPMAAAYYRNVEVHESPLDCVVVEDSILIAYSALFDSNTFNIQRAKTYLKALDLNWGIAVNFGKTAAYMTGIRRTS